MEDGRVTFDRREGFRGDPLTVSCGRCVGCRLERSRQWAVRIMHEAQMHERNSFVTLTYNDEKVPWDGSLKKADWQHFARRLRKKVGKFRYFHCGEYGELRGRPHYHAALFGHDFMFDRTLYTMSNGFPLYNSPTLDKAWGHGYCQIGNLTFESAAYVARYIMKKVNGAQAENHYLNYTDLDTGEVVSRTPEYTTMSLKPGIGASWFEKYQGDVFPRDEVISNGRPARPPKFYDGLLERTDPEQLEEIKYLRSVKAKRRYKDNTPERLAVREKLKELQARRLKRTI